MTEYTRKESDEFRLSTFDNCRGLLPGRVEFNKISKEKRFVVDQDGDVDITHIDVDQGWGRSLDKKALLERIDDLSARGIEPDVSLQALAAFEMQETQEAIHPADLSEEAIDRLTHD